MNSAQGNFWSVDDIRQNSRDSTNGGCRSANNNNKTKQKYKALANKNNVGLAAQRVLSDVKWTSVRFAFNFKAGF